MNTITLVCKNVKFYSPMDEEAFFHWKDKIDCVTGFKGLGDEMLLTVDLGKLTDDCLREIIGIFYRYKIGMGQLKKCLTEENKWWFCNPDMDWYKKIFLS